MVVKTRDSLDLSCWRTPFGFSFKILLLFPFYLFVLSAFLIYCFSLIWGSSPPALFLSSISCDLSSCLCKFLYPVPLVSFTLHVGFVLRLCRRFRPLRRCSQILHRWVLLRHYQVVLVASFNIRHLKALKNTFKVTCQRSMRVCLRLCRQVKCSPCVPAMRSVIWRTTFGSRGRSTAAEDRIQPLKLMHHLWTCLSAVWQSGWVGGPVSFSNDANTSW